LQGGAFVEQVSVVLADHLQVFVSEQLPQVFQLVRMLDDELPGEMVTQVVRQEAVRQFDPPCPSA
jgi:hypothetical protein